MRESCVRRAANQVVNEHYFNTNFASSTHSCQRPFKRLYEFTPSRLHPTRFMFGMTDWLERMPTDSCAVTPGGKEEHMIMNHRHW